MGGGLPFASYSGLPADGTAYKEDIKLKMPGDIWSGMNGKVPVRQNMPGWRCWDPPALIRSASRNWGETTGAEHPGYGSAGLGFRIAKTL